MAPLLGFSGLGVFWSWAFWFGFFGFAFGGFGGFVVVELLVGQCSVSRLAHRCCGDCGRGVTV